jgi:hypothetical protein
MRLSIKERRRKKRREMQNGILPFGSQFLYTTTTASTRTCIGDRFRYVFWEHPRSPR